MDWICYYLLPLAAAWKKRSDNLGDEVFSLYGVMLSTFLAFWAEGFVTQSLMVLIPSEWNMYKPWCSGVSVIMIWSISFILFNKILHTLSPDGFDGYIFPDRTSKILVPLIVFFKTGLICAALFSVFSLTPAAKYVPFIAQHESLCSGARFRVLFNSFLIDRFSLQPESINSRRRAFDRYVPEQTVQNGNSQTSQKGKDK